MKLFKVFLFVIFLLPVKAQVDTLKSDSTKSEICIERGHIKNNICTVTLLTNYSYYVDLEDRTLFITENPNTVSYYCLRCGLYIQETIKPDTLVIWNKKPE